MISPPDTYLYATVAVFMLASAANLFFAIAGYFRRHDPVVLAAQMFGSVVSFGFAVRYAQLTMPGFPGYPLPSAAARPFFFLIGLSVLALAIVLFASQEQRHKLQWMHIEDQQQLRTIRDLEAREARRQEWAGRIRHELMVRLVTNVRHEMLTPLTVIIAALDMLLAGELGPITNEQRPPLESSSAASRRIQFIMDTFGAYARATAGTLHIEEVHLSVLLYDVVACPEIWINTRRDRGDVTIQTAVPNGILIYCDYDLVRTAVVGLMNNAIKFSKKLAEDKQTYQQGRIKLGLQLHNDEVHIMVQDNGIGIPKDRQRLIFAGQLDYKSTRRYEGTGLGLAAVEQVARAHNGRVDLESELGAGSTFTLVLPVERGDKHGHT